MAMNFWEAQRQAKKKTALYLCVFALLTLCTAGLAEGAFRLLTTPETHTGFPLIGTFFVGTTFAVALFQYLMFQTYGGGYVAQSMGGKRIQPNLASAKERELLHTVEEMALASALPVPPVYLIEANQINAFAAGLNAETAAIGVTRGALHQLSREELQGVIAHEFGHIYNKDMKISMHLAAMVMGFVFILYLAFRIFQYATLTGRRRDSKGGNPLLIAGVVLLIAGIFTWFFGSILKAMVSRQREYLADACAVQFTRNPQGIAKALQKIAKSTLQDMPKQGVAYSHLYFDNRSLLGALFATHPPLSRRIAAIEGRESS